MIISSILLGTSGEYSLFGIPVKFDLQSNTVYDFNGDGLLENIGNFLTKNRVFNILTFGYLHTFVHEFGHALAAKILGDSPSIEIRNGGGVTRGSNSTTFSLLSGPLANLIFSISKIFIACAFRATIGAPLTGLIIAGSAIWIFGELFYAYYSLKNNDHGDSAKIARNGTPQLVASIAIVVTTLALS